MTEENKTVPFDKPITSEMKAICIGEFSFTTEEPEFNSDGEYTGEKYDKTHVVPWDLCKNIYKAMLTAAPSVPAPKIEKITVPAIRGLDPVYAYFEDIKDGEVRVTLICYDLALTAWWGGMGDDRTAKKFFMDCGVDYLHGNFGRSPNYKMGKQNESYYLKIIQSVHDYLHQTGAHNEAVSQ